MGAVGIAALGDSSVVTNSGRVFSNQSAAIYFGAPSATLNLLGGTSIQGPVAFSGGGNTVTFGPALNAVMSFAGSGLPQTILTGGRPFVIGGSSVAVVDITGFASSGALIKDLTDGIAGVTEARMFSPYDGVPTPHNGPEAWVSTFGGVRSQGGLGASAGFSEALGGVVTGAESRSGDGFLCGVLLGVAAGSTEVDDDAQEIVHRSMFAGGYLGYDGGAHFAEATLVAGVLDEQSHRRVANNMILCGVEVARDDFNSVFLSPSLSFGTRLPVAAGTLIPSMRLRYAGLFVDDYEEPVPTAIWRSHGTTFRFSRRAANWRWPWRAYQQAGPDLANHPSGRDRRHSPRQPRSGHASWTGYLFRRRWSKGGSAGGCRRGPQRGNGRRHDPGYRL